MHISAVGSGVLRPARYSSRYSPIGDGGLGLGLLGLGLLAHLRQAIDGLGGVSNSENGVVGQGDLSRPILSSSDFT